MPSGGFERGATMPAGSRQNAFGTRFSFRGWHRLPVLFRGRLARRARPSREPVGAPGGLFQKLRAPPRHG